MSVDQSTGSSSNPSSGSSSSSGSGSGKRAARALATRNRLLVAARELFAAQGYAGTTTEQVLARTGATRGGLYHHFADKADLFAAVCEELHGEATTAILSAVHTAGAGGDDAFVRLLAGCDAWIDFMAAGDARRLLVIEAPTVLGWERWNELDQRHGFALLRAGIEAARDEAGLPPIPVDELAILLNGAMNYAVMMAREPDAAAHLARSKQALHLVLHALRARAPRPDAPG